MIGAEKVFENIMAEKFPNLVKDTDLQISKISMNANRINFKKTMSRHNQTTENQKVKRP